MSNGVPGSHDARLQHYESGKASRGQCDTYGAPPEFHVTLGAVDQQRKLTALDRC